MQPTALVYSSHSRSHVLHHDLIVQRALAGKENKRIFLLPMSMAPHHGDEGALQHEEANNFGWYFRKFESQGLEYVPFYWSSGLRQVHVDLLFKYLADSEVVILAGGSSVVGLERYKDLGARFGGDPERFKKLLEDRQRRGLLTVGFSAGADQLMDNLFRITQGQSDKAHGFGLIAETLITLHHDASRNGQLQDAAKQFGKCRVFGLPNDSGLAVTRGNTPSGGRWQLTGFVLDRSWDRPEDAWHVRTRSGANVEHFYADGRHWGFREGDWMLRIHSKDGAKDQTWIRSGGRTLDYATQQPVEHAAPDELIARG